MTFSGISPRVAAALLPLALIIVAGCGTEAVKRQQVQDDLQVALQRAEVGNTQEAQQWAERAIKIAPQDVSTYVYTPANEDDTDRLSLVDPNEGDNGVFTAVGDDTDAIHYLTEAVKKFPNTTEPLLALENLQGRTGDIAGQRATAATLAALIERQIHAPGHAVGAAQNLLLAQAYWDAGDTAKGTADYQDVIRVYPHDPLVTEAYNGLAYAYAVANDKPHLLGKLGALDLAKTALKMAQSEGSTDEYIGSIQDTLGWVQYRLGDTKDALINIQQGVSSNPRLPECRYHLAMVYKALGDTDAAKMELGYAVRLSQDYADAKRELEALPQTTTPQASASNV